MKRETVLKLFEAEHGEIDPGLREDFLAEESVEGLSRFTTKAVAESFTEHDHPIEALAHAEWIVAGKVPGEGLCIHETWMDIVDGHEVNILWGGPMSCVAKCNCGWERSAGSPEVAYGEWLEHAHEL